MDISRSKPHINILVRGNGPLKTVQITCISTPYTDRRCTRSSERSLTKSASCRRWLSARSGLCSASRGAGSQSTTARSLWPLAAASGPLRHLCRSRAGKRASTCGTRAWATFDLIPSFTMTCRNLRLRSSKNGKKGSAKLRRRRCRLRSKESRPQRSETVTTLRLKTHIKTI
jgi:hypothetical protein